MAGLEDFGFSEDACESYKNLRELFKEWAVSVLTSKSAWVSCFLWGRLCGLHSQSGVERPFKRQLQNRFPDKELG